MFTLANLKYRVLILGVVRQRNKVQLINVTHYHDSHLNQKNSSNLLHYYLQLHSIIFIFVMVSGERWELERDSRNP